MSDKEQLNRFLEAVKEFHETFNLPVLHDAKIPSEDRCELRVNLLQEELDELKEAIDEQDIVGVADALADLQYVLSGAVLEFGLTSRFEDLFEEVQRSNLSKACDNLQEAEDTQKAYQKRQQDSNVEKVNGKFVVYRNGDKKVLKSVKYSPPNFEKLL